MAGKNKYVMVEIEEVLQKRVRIVVPADASEAEAIAIAKRRYAGGEIQLDYKDMKEINYTVVKPKK